jgi:acyl-[acyl-carrier-protein]-phospholipid O-acyltransferase/long-chain-fatty-acid--[acyl-carrier-protein] ligase
VSLFPEPRCFLPFFLVQFLSAANDNLFKNAVALLVIYRLDGAAGFSPQVAVSLGAGLFILPFFLLSAWGGLLADHFPKRLIIRWTKSGEAAVAMLAAWSLTQASLSGMMTALFLMGCKSACFGPVKYAVLPELLKPSDLVRGNALVESATFLAILVGTITGGLLVLRPNGTAEVGGLMLVLAALGVVAAFLVPSAGRAETGGRLSFNLPRLGWQAFGFLRHGDGLLGASLGISWFWFLGATFLAQFPALAKLVLGADERAVTLMLTMFALGVGGGAALGGLLLKRIAAPRLGHGAALAMGLLCCHLGLVEAQAPAADFLAFLARPSSWRVLGELLGIAVCGGVFVLPLYIRLQRHSDSASRSRVVGANNILNALFMVASALVSAAALGAGGTVPGLILGIGGATVSGALAKGLRYRNAAARK